MPVGSRSGRTAALRFTAETGVYRGLESLGWVPGFDEAVSALFIFKNKPRVVVITDRRIAVFSASRLSKKQPKSLMHTLPRATRLDHGTHKRSKLMLGPESIRIERSVYRILDKANAEIGPEPALASSRPR